MKLAATSSVILALALMAPIQTQAQQSRQRDMQQNMQRETTRDRAGSDAPLTQAERVTTDQFIKKAWNINQFEIDAGKEAKNKAKGAQGLEDYAEMIIDDHTKMNDDLKSILQKTSAGADLPKGLDNEHQQKLNQLKTGGDKDFTRQFRAQQIKGHQEALRLFQSYASNGDNAELKSWAQSSVAMLQRHLDRAEKLGESSGVM